MIPYAQDQDVSRFDRHVGRVFFRVDAGQKMGSGHLVRCRLLARALRMEGVEATFLTATPDNPLVVELREEGFAVTSLANEEATSAEAITRRAHTSGERSLVVVDDHRADFHTSSFQQHIRQAGLGLMLISFRHGVRFSADVVLNPNLVALEHTYAADAHTRMLLGPRYAVLDDSFRRLRERVPPIPQRASTVLVTFGGADHTDQTRKAVDALALLDTPPRRLVVVVGGMYEKTGPLEAHLRHRLRLDAELYVNTSEMPALMAASDLAVSSGGLTAWELACLGVPNAVLSTADAERQTGRLLSREGYGLYLGHHDSVVWPQAAAALGALMRDAERRRRFADRSRALVDGCGTQRVVEHIKALVTNEEANA